MFSSSSSSDQNSRSQHHTATTTTSTYLQPSASHRPPTLSTSNSNFAEGHQAATPGAFAAQAFATSPSPHHSSQQQSPDLLHASVSRNRSISARQSSPTSESVDLRRSHSLNDGNMSNSQAYYTQIAAPMGSYGQPQIYGQGPLSPTSYHQALPAQVPLPSAGYMDYQPRQAMPSMAYYDSPMQYSQSSYPAGYATSYAGAGVISAQSYGAPMQSQQYARPDQPAALAGAPVQVVDRAKKPQCWEHGCNGREFSTFSNLLRHQREKSGTAAKSYCPHCGAEFTRTTARNGHMEHGKCKTRRAATGSQTSS